MNTINMNLTPDKTCIMDSVLAGAIRDAIVAYKEDNSRYTKRYPNSLYSLEQWNDRLDVMIKGFDLLNKQLEHQSIGSKESQMIELALSYFSQDLPDMWW